MLPKPEPRGPKPRKRIARGQRPRRVRATKWAADREECDTLCGRITKVERGGRCENCGTTRRKALQWAHGFSRRYMSTRYDSENVFSLCAGCHKTFTHNQIAWSAWMRSSLGEARYQALEIRAQLLVRFEPMLVIGFRARAEKLGVLTEDGWRAWQGVS